MKQELFLLDIETQTDFFLPRGSRFTPQAHQAAENIYRLFDWAWDRQIPVISTVLRVRLKEAALMGDAPFCVDGTAGEEKLPGTILPRYIDLGLRNSTDLPYDLFERYQQVIFEQRSTDIFAHAGLERLITEAGQAAYVLCGAGVTKGIIQAALGLRHRNLDVNLATDAVLDFGNELTEIAYQCMEAKGVKFRLTEELVAPRRHKRLALCGLRKSG